MHRTIRYTPLDVRSVFSWTTSQLPNCHALLPMRSMSHILTFLTLILTWRSWPTHMIRVQPTPRRQSKRVDCGSLFEVWNNHWVDLKAQKMDGERMVVYMRSPTERCTSLLPKNGENGWTCLVLTMHIPYVIECIKSSVACSLINESDFMPNAPLHKPLCFLSVTSVLLIW